MFSWYSNNIINRGEETMNKRGALLPRDIVFMVIIFAGIIALSGIFVNQMGDTYDNENMYCWTSCCEHWSSCELINGIKIRVPRSEKRLYRIFDKSSL